MVELKLCESAHKLPHIKKGCENEYEDKNEVMLVMASYFFTLIVLCVVACLAVSSVLFSVTA